MTLHWRESSRLADGVARRDSKHPEHGHTVLTARAFAVLLTYVRSGDLG